jgi:hypothetical protein
MRLHAIGGLCNRLQAILSYRAAHGGQLEVLWKPDLYVSHALFSDVFEPIPGVTFMTDGGHDKEDWGIDWSAPPDWRSSYALLTPKVPILPPAGDYVAVHARRTDHIPNMNATGDHKTTDEELRTFVEKYPTLPIYLATDNGETQARWAKDPRVIAGRVLPGTEAQGLTDHHRNGTLDRAVQDLYLCAAAKHFMGTHNSTFTRTIEILRSLK